MMQRLVPLLTVLACASAQNEVNCDSFNCRHNSKCKSGDADFSSLHKLAKNIDFLKETSRNDQHCDCNEGHTGLQCDVPFETCHDGKTVCFNKGGCHKSTDGSYRCDCTEAEGYASGKHCESQASAICDASKDGLETESWFCVNGGACHDNHSSVHEKCKCPDGFTGPHCETKEEAVAKGEAKDPKADCTLSCKKGGQCVFGYKNHGNKHSHVEDLYFLKDKEKDGMHCICPEGFAGLQCEVRLDKCGSKFCYHGATCVTETDDFGSGNKFCDCTTATDLLDAGAMFAGKFCESKSTKICDNAEGSLPHFCTNGGRCHNKAHLGCDCGDSKYSGPFCEFKGEEPKCKLKCKHGGQCRHGINNNFERGELGKKFNLGDAFDLGHMNFEHCACPDGYYGIDCSMKVKKCGSDADADHVCANDGECVPTGTNKDGEIKWGCDCKGGTWAGQYCEHSASQLCVMSGDPVESGNKGAFCTNGGTCANFIDKKEDYVGCDCPVGFHGKKCQYQNGVDVVKEISTPKPKKESSSYSSSSDSESGGMSKAGVFVVVVASVGIVLVVLSR